jgi:raffinose/stachyose/melibiose transport system permease protein/N-acetylglucosamine transport system permease protein
LAVRVHNGIGGAIRRKFFSRKSLSETILHALVWVIFSFVALTYLYIFFWGVTAGFKTHTEISLAPFALPEKLQWRNYIDVFRLLTVNNYGFVGMLLNSVYFSVLGVLITIMSTCMLAYVTSKYKFPGARWYFFIATLVISLPIYGNGGRMYRLLYRLNFINSYTQIFLAFSGININYLYFHAAFKSMSWSYAEAAFIDGANDFQVFFQIMLPQAINIVGALFLISWVASWNDYSGALIYLPKRPTLAIGIYMFELDTIYMARRDILYAAYIISAIPPLVLFAIFNNALTSNVSLGGIKE